jgi:hypothetical protein
MGMAFVAGSSEYLTLEGINWTYECEVMIARGITGEKFYRKSDFYTGIRGCSKLGDICYGGEMFVNEEGKSYTYISETSVREIMKEFIRHVDGCDICWNSLLDYEVSSDDEEVTPAMCVRTRSMRLADPREEEQLDLVDPGSDDDDDYDEPVSHDFARYNDKKRQRVVYDYGDDSDNDDDYLPQPRFKLRKLY